MRTRLLVALAALIAVSALVAGPGLVGAQPSSTPKRIDAAQFRAVTVDPSAGPLAMATSTPDIANRSAGWLAPDSPLAEFGAPPAAADGRSDAPAPTVVPVTVPKPTTTPTPTPKPATAPAPRPAVATTSTSAWHLDPDVSWYGPGMYGNRTACGVPLTTTVLGVANRTLPCGTKVTFRNPANGRTVTVPVIDRGPYVTGRYWDMTGGLCVYLNHCYTGPMEWRLAG